MEFPDLAVLKIEAEHPMPSLDQLCVSLETRKSTCFHVLASIQEEYVEEINLVTYIQSMLIVPSLEVRVAAPSDRTLEVTPAV